MADNSIPGNAQTPLTPSEASNIPLTDGFDWDEQWSLIVRLTTKAQRLSFLASLPVESSAEDFRANPIDWQDALHEMVSEYACELYEMAGKLRVPPPTYPRVFGRVAEPQPGP